MKSHINIARIDLNLLKTFLAIWEFRSLTGAAEKLHLSQPATSHSLRRLREIFNDPLFIRTSSAMMPSDAAIRLYVPIASALETIENALQHHAQFEPALSDRTFRLAMSDMCSSHILPIALKELGKIAPKISFEIDQLPIDALSIALRNGDVDLAFGYLPGLSADCKNHTLFYDEYICMLRKGHLFSRQPLTMESMMKLRYIYTASNSTGHKLAENVFRKAGLNRDIAVRLPHFTSAPNIVRDTDLALILPRSIAELCNQGKECVILDLPLDIPRIPIQLHTHARFSGDNGISWLRSTLAKMFAIEDDNVNVRHLHVSCSETS